MRYVSMIDTKPGMRLAKSVYDSVGRILVAEDMCLTDNVIQKLRNFGFDGIYIADEISKGIEVESIISPALRNSGMECVRRKDVDGCHDIAKQMVAELLKNGSLSFNIKDLRSYDDYTFAHSVNVAVVCGVIGLGLHLNEDDLTNLVLAGLLHDLGKVKIPLEILNKPERLSPMEFEIMKTHSVKSYQLICERWDLSAKVKAAVLFHHENVDGSGYPKGLHLEKHTLFTRILHVADVYDALVSKRPYKDAYSQMEAVEYLMGGCGSMFDRKMVEQLLNYVPFYPKGTALKLTDGRCGVVYDNNGVHNLRPVIKLFSGDKIDLAAKENLNLAIAPLEWKNKFSKEQLELQRIKMIQPA